LFLSLLFVALLGNEAKIAYLKEVSIPKNIYEGMVFEVTYDLLVLDEFDSIETSFEGGSVSVLNKSAPWKKIGDSQYTNSFLFQSKTKQIKLPAITVLISKNGSQIGSDTLSSQSLTAIPIDVGDFCGVFADSLGFKESRITIFDDNSNIMVFGLEAKNSNLQDFKLAGFQKQGIESKSGNYKESELIYYVIIPKERAELSFKYFNTKNNRLETLSLKNVPNDEKVSTQSDLKPKNTLHLTKMIALGAVVLLFLLLYILKRKKIYLIITIVALIWIFFYIFQKGTLTLKEGSSVYILPTFNSTVVYTTKKDEEAKILADKEGYIKVEIDNKIGWIRKSAIKN